MTLPVVLRAEAKEDLLQAHDYLKELRPELAERFLAEIRQLFERIESRPELYGFVWGTVRAARLKKFQYVVYYTVIADRVEILAILHGSRKPPPWRLQV